MCARAHACVCVYLYGGVCGGGGGGGYSASGFLSSSQLGKA